MKNLIFIIIICLLSTFSNYQVFISYKNQSLLLKDAREDNFNFGDLISLEYIYPNLAINSVPILAYFSRYYTERGDYKNAINMLNVSLIQNPYSLYAKYLLSRNYIYIDDYQNSEKILESIFDLSPKIESSTSLYLYILGENKKISKLINYQNKLSEIDNYTIWSFYLSAVEKNISNKADSLFFNSLKEIFEKKF